MRWTHAFARHACEATIEMIDHRFRYRSRIRGQRRGESDASARRFGLRAGDAIRRAQRHAQAAFHALIGQFGDAGAAGVDYGRFMRKHM